MNIFLVEEGREEKPVKQSADEQGEHSFYNYQTNF